MSQFHNGNQYNRNNYNRSADYAQYRERRYDHQTGNAQNYMNQNHNNQTQNQYQPQQQQQQWNMVNELTTEQQQQQHQQQQPQQHHNLYGQSERLNAYNNQQGPPAAYNQNTPQQFNHSTNSSYNNSSSYTAQCGGYNYNAGNYNNTNQYVNGYNGYQNSYNHNNNNSNHIYQPSGGVNFGVNNFTPANPPLPLQPPPASPPPPPPPPTTPPPDSPASRAPTPGFAAGMHEHEAPARFELQQFNGDDDVAAINDMLDDDQENNNLLDVNNRYNIEGNNYQPIFEHNDISMEFHLPQQQQHQQQQQPQQPQQQQQATTTHADFGAQQDLEQLLLQTEMQYISDSGEASNSENNEVPNQVDEPENYNTDSSADHGDDEEDYDDDEQVELIQKDQLVMQLDSSSSSSSSSSNSSSSSSNSSVSSSASSSSSEAELEAERDNKSPVSSEVALVERQWHETMAGLNLSESSDSNSDPNTLWHGTKWDNKRNQNLYLNVKQRISSELEEDVESLKKQLGRINDNSSSSNASGKSKKRKKSKRRARVANEAPIVELMSLTEQSNYLYAQKTASEAPWRLTPPPPTQPTADNAACTPQSTEGTDIKLQATAAADARKQLVMNSKIPNSPPLSPVYDTTCVYRNWTPQSPIATPKSPEPRKPPTQEGPCSPDQDILSDESMASLVKFNPRPAPTQQQALPEEEDRCSDDESMAAFVKLKYRAPTPPMGQVQQWMPALVPGLVERLVEARRTDGFNPNCSAKHVFSCQRISEGATRVEQPVLVYAADGVTQVDPEQYELYLRLATEVQELQAQMKEIEDGGSKVDKESLQYFDSRVAELNNLESQFQWVCVDQQPIEGQPLLGEQTRSGCSDRSFAELSLTEYAFVRYMREIEHVTCIPTKCRASEEDKVTLNDFRVVRVLGRGGE